jgi:hypothetical protein
MGSYMAYKVNTKTNLSFFKKKEASVSRRFSDFLGRLLGDKKNQYLGYLFQKHGINKHVVFLPH